MVIVTHMELDMNKESKGEFQCVTNRVWFLPIQPRAFGGKFQWVNWSHDRVMTKILMSKCVICLHWHSFQLMKIQELLMNSSHICKKPAELLASLKIIMCRVGQEGTYAMVFDHQHCFHKIWGLYMSKWGMDFSVPKTAQKGGPNRRKITKEIYTLEDFSSRKVSRRAAGQSKWEWIWSSTTAMACKAVSYLPWRGTWKHG